MKKTALFKTVCSLFIVSCFLSIVPAVMAASSAEVKARMEKRLPSINALKAKGIIGENSKGFLAFVGQSKEGPDIVSAENADRAAVYAAIAKQQGTSADMVGSRRAIQIAQNAKPGEWLQDASGKWKKK
ncbi:MAG: hypothetical protein A2017_11370 [Lentisphaerae bacterium GWF2_44_16]|nr:MAG: hypothetical protein A2017_11370 [Lentisphaerae bacterium GWF2_44_16]